LNDSQNALTSLINGAEYAIQGRALPFNTADAVALGFKSELAGDFTIAIDHVDGLFLQDQNIFLKDNLTNSIHDLKAAPYNFTTAGGIDNTRFELVYENLLSVQPNQFTANQVVTYTQNQQLTINSGSVKMNRVEVYDVRGRLIANANDINASEMKLNVGAAHQVLIVKITSNDRQTVTKKVLN
jgi:hypothetical protein